MAQQDTIAGRPSVWRDKTAIILTATIFGLTYGLSAPLIALQLTEDGYSETIIGFNAAMHALGVLAIAPFLPQIVARFGTAGTALVALIAGGVLLVLFPAVPLIWLWFPLRLALGVVSESLFVVSETWLNQVTEEKTRAQTMAMYSACLSLGFALGPLILVIAGSQGALPFLIGAAFALVAAAVLIWGKPKAQVVEHHTRMTLARAWQLAPIAIVATALNSAMETAGLSLLAIYAMELGWEEKPATLLITTLLAGAIVLQLPIGWLADRVDRRKFVMVLAVLSTIGAALWPAMLSHGWLAYVLLFLWGGVFVGIYTLMITIVGSRFKGGDLVALYAIMSVAWGLGALVGPPLGGLAMQSIPHGLAIFAAAGCAAFVLFLWRSKSEA